MARVAGIVCPCNVLVAQLYFNFALRACVLAVPGVLLDCLAYQELAVLFMHFLPVLQLAHLGAVPHPPALAAAELLDWLQVPVTPAVHNAVGTIWMVFRSGKKIIFQLVKVFFL